MVPDITRRAALRRGSVGLAATLAGCGGGGVGGGASPTATDTDAGTDSYGIVLDNRSPLELDVRLTVKKLFAEEPYWQKTPLIDGQSKKQWNSVVTKEEEQLVKARMLNKTHSSEYTVLQELATLRITPGSDSAPDVPNVRVFVTWRKDSKNARADLNVQIPLPGNSPTRNP